MTYLSYVCIYIYVCIHSTVTAMTSRVTSTLWRDANLSTAPASLTKKPYKPSAPKKTLMEPLQLQGATLITLTWLTSDPS